MQRARRLVLVTVLALAGGLALVGCRAEPGVAAYVGGAQISEERVDRILAELRRKLPGDTPPGAQRPRQAQLPSRKDVVNTFVTGEVAKRLAADTSVRPEQVDADQLAVRAGLPAGTEFGQLYGEMFRWTSALQEAVQPVQPAEADLRALQRRLTADGQVPPGMPFEEFVQRIPMDRVGMSLGLQKALGDTAAKMRVVVNPRYRPLEQQVDTGIVVQFGEGTPAVTDRP
jgi:hypothetical protein